MKTVLISGASVAGLTLAHWLRRHGYAPTVVERAPALRPGGQALDVRGVALGVLERMGILPEARALRTRMRGMTMLDGDGNEQWSSTEMALSSGRLDSDDIELLRDDLTQLLYGQARDGVEYLFGDHITALDEDAYGVHATFEHGPRRSFDLVVGADGLHSAVRRLAFGPERDFVHHLGPHVAVFATENFLELDNWQTWLTDGTATYCLYPARDNSEMRVTLGFMAPEPVDYDYRDTEAQKALVAERMSHLGGDAPRLLKAMWDAPNFYFDAMAQTRMDHWTKGRAALVGDAGYCPSPLSGQGSSLALVGAYALADELGRADGDHAAAFARYEERLRPYVELNQALATENPDGPPAEESAERAKNAFSLDA
ncbi:FAD-dependent monooxygenase [Streptomyces sp. NPDC050610]|uniref:FAD-dependent monooxygenase n=1 Tax=Streptomyces sp. NPDC050610 TaxID=3157097 RepID=UPI0034481DC2